MYFSNQSKKNSTSKKQNHICPKCRFDNYPAALYCEICFYPLNVVKYQPHKPIPVASSPDPEEVQTPNNLQQELKKPSVISGLLVLGLAIALWFN
jgi:hypothetical protein